MTEIHPERVIERAPVQPAERLPATLLRENDRLKTLVEVSRAAAALGLPDLIERVGRVLQGRDWSWEFTSLCLHEPAENALRIHALVTPPEPLYASHSLSRGMLVPLTVGSITARAFTSGEACVFNSRAEYEANTPAAWLAEMQKRFGMPRAYSICVVPLICRGKPLGTIQATAWRDRAFDDEAIQFLSRVADGIAPAVDNALAHLRIKELSDRLANEKTYLEGEVESAFGDVVGGGPGLRKTLALVESVADTGSTVLLLGETGTGKELLARAIHRLSGRHQHTFVKLNCASIPSGLLESELFGHERGAFTGAISQKVGRFELADGGTFFLDEVGEIPLDLQPKLLRVLQEREFERVGGTRTLKINVRLIAATNRDLGRMQNEGTFRADLFHRLNVFPIVIPPLRERRADLPSLLHHFVQRSCSRLRKHIDEIPPATLRTLEEYDWPGNVRELENVVERAVILARGPVLEISREDLGIGARRAEAPLASPPFARGALAATGTVTASSGTLAEAERSFIMQALEASNWVVGGRLGAAQRLGLSRTTLQARMRKMNIRRNTGAQGTG
jgi:formate hydrogenlyase transcriptional activator